MSTTYENLLSGINNLTKIDWDSDTPQSTLLGQRFLAHCRKENFDPGQDLAAVAEEWHDFLGAAGWGWDLNFACETYPYATRLLDGVRLRGDCGYPAYAFALLLNAPHPWGFGLGGATVERYDGHHHEGFIATHNGTIFGLGGNLTRPNGGVLQGFYLWDNHKVVAHGGHYYDVSYRRDFNALGNLAPASLQVTRENVRLRDLANYDPKSPWGFTLGWGLPRLAMLKLSDVATNNSHGITVFRATNVGNGALTGYYIQWEEYWGWRGSSQRANYYGPYTQNPLVR
ncbi:MAG: hypothetical protein JOZ54_06390 [Acidobacteria bacterium]|nr:hypothetical protein [Acidobacteriota bacterium]